MHEGTPIALLPQTRSAPGATCFVVREEDKRTVLHHYHFACGKEMLEFLEQSRGSCPVRYSLYSDMYFDSANGDLRANSAWLRYRCDVEQNTYSWRLISTENERLRDSDAKVEYGAIDDEAVILNVVNSHLRQPVKHLQALKVIAKFTFYRTAIDTEWGSISVDEVRSLPNYFWICTASLKNPAQSEDHLLAHVRAHVIGPSFSKVCTCLQPDDAVRLGVHMNSAPFHELIPVPYVYESDDESE